MVGILSHGRSDVGLKRSNNEDSLVLRPDLGFVAVADGMGGPASGEVASRIFAESAVEVFAEDGGGRPLDPFASVQKVFRLANERILARAAENPDDQGMGCTAELLAFQENAYVLGHVGDSRTYLFRQGQLRQITRDHSLVQDQVDQGVITPEEARRHAMRNVILRAVGVQESLAVDLIRGKSLPGDVFLLCSDGLSDMVDDASIRETLAAPLPPAGTVDRLIELALASGGHDNVTVVLCEVRPPR